MRLADAGSPLTLLDGRVWPQLRHQRGLVDQPPVTLQQVDEEIERFRRDGNEAAIAKQQALARVDTERPELVRQALTRITRALGDSVSRFRARIAVVRQNSERRHEATSGTCRQVSLAMVARFVQGLRLVALAGGHRAVALENLALRQQ